MVLNKKLITYIVIIIFIIITLLHLYKININNDNNKELFEDLMADQNLQKDVYINKMSQVKFGIKPNTRSLLTSMNEKASRDELNTTKTDLNRDMQTEIIKMQTDLTNGLSDKITKTELNNAMPEYSVIDYSGSIAPYGWQLCDGAPLTYQDTTTSTPNELKFIKGVNNLPINTPDLRGRFILGANQDKISGTSVNFDRNIRKINEYGGEETHVLSIEEMPEHNHSNNITRVDDDGRGEWNQFNMGELHGAGTDIQIGYEGGNGAHNNMPPFYVLTYIIKQPIRT